MMGIKTTQCRSRMHGDRRISTNFSDLVSQNKASTCFTHEQRFYCKLLQFSCKTSTTIFFALAVTFPVPEKLQK